MRLDATQSAPTPTPADDRVDDGSASRHLRRVYPAIGQYADRDGKAAWIARRFRAILGGRVLDVGCDTARLRAHLPASASYLGIDRTDEADLSLDLDARDLPFEDRSFDTVVCTDVLEHLERLHGVFDELCRVSADRVLISLPNPIRSLLCELHAGRATGLKHYGLPTDPPADRHRWFFGFEEAAAFAADRGARSGFAVEHLDAESAGVPAWLRGSGVDVLDHPNLRLGTMWCVLRRDPGPDA